MNTLKTPISKIRDIIEIDEELCDGCGLCLEGCAESALSLIDGKVKLISDIYCDGLGACLKKCPTGALKIIKRSSEDFDPIAVQSKINGKNNIKVSKSCPGSKSLDLSPEKIERQNNNNQPKSKVGLTSWPIQMGLISPDSSFLNKKALILAADCTAFACSSFHDRFLDGDIPLVMGCPKLDDQKVYVERLSAILRANTSIKELRLVVMEVPCCWGVVILTQQALKMAGIKEINLMCNIVSIDGLITSEKISVSID